MAFAKIIQVRKTPMANFKLTIEYDGTAYCGWQRQAGDPTLQETIETALSVMTRETIRVIGSGRTDAGVHALGQTAHFHTRTGISSGEFQAGLNSLLPDDIVIRSCEPVPEDFHARFNARHKTYRYMIRNQRLPAAIGRQYAWHIRKPLDIAAMRTAAGHIIGTIDFKSFEGTGSPRADTIRTVLAADVVQTPTGDVMFEVTATGFLRYMVRNLMGTLVQAGLEKIHADDFKTILEARDRHRAGPTAPPHGLFLVSVFYETSTKKA
jgi:tRNA pseudouridine38-40 synthase